MQIEDLPKMRPLSPGNSSPNPKKNKPMCEVRMMKFIAMPCMRWNFQLHVSRARYNTWQQRIWCAYSRAKFDFLLNSFITLCQSLRSYVRSFSGKCVQEWVEKLMSLWGTTWRKIYILYMLSFDRDESLVLIKWITFERHSLYRLWNEKIESCFIGNEISLFYQRF